MITTYKAASKKRKRDETVISKPFRAYKRKGVTSTGGKVPRFPLTTNISSLVFPAKKRATLTYATRQAYTVNATAGLIGPLQWRVNGMFDPQVSLGGIQPLGFDQWMAMYKYFTVISAHCKLTYLSNIGVAGSSSGGFGLFITNSDAPIVTSANQAVTSQYSNWAPWISGQQNKTVSLSWSAAKYFGVKDVLDDDTYAGTNGVDPLRQAYVNVWADGWAAGQASGNFLLEIAYDAIFHEPREVGES